MMIDFIRGGLIHFSNGGHSPCGSAPMPKGTPLQIFLWYGIEPEPFVFPEPCPICTPIRDRYFKFLKNGGSMSGWDIRPNEDREDASAYKARSEDAGG